MELDNIMGRINDGKAICAFNGTGFVLRSKRFDAATGERLEDEVRPVTREEVEMRVRTFTQRANEIAAVLKDDTDFLAYMDTLEKNVALFPDDKKPGSVAVSDQAK